MGQGAAAQQRKKKKFLQKVGLLQNELIFLIGE